MESRKNNGSGRDRKHECQKEEDKAREMNGYGLSCPKAYCNGNQAKAPQRLRRPAFRRGEGKKRYPDRNA